MWKLLLIVPLAYLAVCGAVYAAQGSMLFPASMVAGAGPLPVPFERMVVRNGDEELHGVHIPPPTPAVQRLAVLGFAGNAWNAEAAALYLHELYPQADVVAFHYRGYRPSTGKPSAEALLADAPLIHDHVVAQLKPDRIVAVGFSIGSGVAARLAGQRPLAGAILVTPFDSLRRVAQRHYPWLPVRWLFRHEMPAAEDLREAQTPVAIIAAERDTIVPAARAEALANAARSMAFQRTIKAAGHNDLYDRPEFRDAMTSAMQAVLAHRP